MATENKHGFTHKIVCPRCRLAFMYLKHLPKDGTPMIAESVFFADGASPKNGDLVKCQYCGFRMHRISPARDIVPVTEAD